MKNNNYWRVSGMAISGDLEDTDSPYQYGDTITNLLNTTHERIVRNKIKNPQNIIKLVNKYDNIPAFKNYLVIFYINKNKVEKAASANRWLLKEHPEYLFGKLNLCAEYLMKEQYEEIPKILGESLSLSDLYPERKVFHYNEFASFLNLSCRYLIATGDLEAAKTRIDMGTEVLGDDFDMIIGLNDAFLRKKQFQRIEKYIPALERRHLKEESLEEKTLPDQITEAPVFENDLVNKLYDFEIGDAPQMLEAVLKLPRESLIRDLEKILLDAPQRHEYFKGKNEEAVDYNPVFNLCLHAMGLLADLGVKEKGPLILKTLSHKQEFLDFWFSDHLTETTWHFIYRLYQDDFQTLKNFLIDPELEFYAKLPILQTIAQIAYHQPEKKEEVVQFLNELLDIFLEKLDKPLISDFETISHVVIDLYSFKAIHLLPKIKIFFDLGLVDESLSGDYKEVEEDMLSEKKYEPKLETFKNTIDLYNHIRSTWSGYQE